MGVADGVTGAECLFVGFGAVGEAAQRNVVRGSNDRIGTPNELASGTVTPAVQEAQWRFDSVKFWCSKVC